MATILCIGGDSTSRRLLQDVLTDLGHRYVLATSLREGLRSLDRSPVDLVISVSRVPDASGLELLESLEADGAGIPVILLADCPSLQHAIASMQGGAVDYLAEPLEPEILRAAVIQALEKAPLGRAGVRKRFRVATDLWSRHGSSAA
jgi:two-component system, NtrC family, nitrogen regulation response regulator GlnG